MIKRRIEKAIRFISHAWYFGKWKASLKCGNHLDPHTILDAADLYAMRGISGGKFKELARFWALGSDITKDVEAVRETCGYSEDYYNPKR